MGSPRSKGSREHGSRTLTGTSFRSASSAESPAEEAVAETWLTSSKSAVGREESQARNSLPGGDAVAFNWHCCIGRPRSRRRNWRDETSQSRRGSWSDPRARVRAGPGARSAAAMAPNDIGVGPPGPFCLARLAVEGLLLLLGV